jgi:hypothetical protein
MIALTPGSRPATVPSVPGRVTVALTVIVAVLAWLLSLSLFVKIAASGPTYGAFYGFLLCGSPLAATWATRRVFAVRRTRGRVPERVLARRYHGDLELITDSDRRSLRPIGVSAAEIASRTANLLDKLPTIPSLRIFHGVRPPGTAFATAHTIAAAHAVACGRSILLVESVTFPPGNYQTDVEGRVRCDGVYIGQSIGPLLENVRQWRRVLPRSHRVSAMVVVHDMSDGEWRLPDPQGTDLLWVPAREAVREIGRWIPDAATISRRSLAALLAATPDGPLAT